MKMRIATLNVRGLRKQHLKKKLDNFTNQTGFFTWLRQSTTDILALQELKFPVTPSADEQKRYNQLLKNDAAVWTSECALFLRNPSLSFVSTDTFLLGRVIVARVRCSSSSFEATFCVVYAPANHKDRKSFFLECLALPFFTSPPSNIFLLGDLNYQHHKHRQYPTFQNWIDFYLTDCFTSLNATPRTTFTHSGNKSRTTIDYVYSSPTLISQTSKPKQLCASPFSDHDMLVLTLTPSNAPTTGRGLWRLNVQLLKNKDFMASLDTFLSSPSLPSPLESRQHHWDRIKEDIKRCCVKGAIAIRLDRDISIQNLNTKRQSTLLSYSRSSGSRTILTQELEELELSLQQQTKENMDKHALRSGTTWREQGEANTGYFFRAIAERFKKRLVPPLHNPTSNTLTTTREEQLQVAVDYYSELYSPDPMDILATQQLLESVPPTATLSLIDKEGLTSRISEQELDAVIDMSPFLKAPGRDGLPFELYRHIVTIPWIRQLLLDVLNDALLHATFPQSWQETVMILLYKKGDASRLANWRPLSLINSDAKFFTKILTLRLQRHMSTLTGSYQMGFTAGRHIADNGLVVNNLRDYCRARKLKHIGVLLDQEKAYDRIHPAYLEVVLDRFGLPQQVIRSIVGLFFSTNISLNINGHISNPIAQGRGLRQGDPLSPLLFNLAFEPLLCTIQYSPTIKGITIPKRQNPVKHGAYADDLLAMVSSVEEWEALDRALQLYGSASNARINLNKTVAFPMSNSFDIPLKTHLSTLSIQWHDETSSDALIYLGFPLFFGKAQQNSFWNKVLAKIKAGIDIHSARSLSVLGRATIVNALLLSRLWHLAWVVPFPVKFLDKVRQLVIKFVCPFKPAASWNVITTPRHQGGLGVINPATQQQVFLLKHLRNATSSNVSWGKDIILDLIFWKTKATHRLAFLLDPQDGRDYNLLRGYPYLQRLVKAATMLPPLKTTIIQAGLPESATFLASPIEWWFPSIQDNNDTTMVRVGEMFKMVVDEHDNYRVTHRPRPLTAAKTARDELIIQLLQTKTRRVSPTFLKAVQIPAVGTNGDTLAQRVCSLALFDTGKTIVTFGSATTRQLRRYLSHPPAPDPEPPPAPSTSGPETGAKANWRTFWNAKIPHRARSIWWRYKCNILPCGTLRARRWNQDPRCDMLGCREKDADQNHYIFQCKSKYLAWQDILKTHTDKPIWSDEDLHSLLTFKPPKFSIKPAHNITIPQLLACCLLGVHTANTTLFLHDHTLSQTEISEFITKQIQTAIMQNNYISSLSA